MALRLTPTRRGDSRTEAVTVRSYGPLRLWARQATLAAPGRVRILPPFHSRAHLPSRLTRLRELDGPGEEHLGRDDDAAVSSDFFDVGTALLFFPA